MRRALQIRRLAGIAVVLLAVGVLSACGGSGGDADIDVGDGGQDIEIAVDGDTFAVDQGEAAIPASWPADVPVPAGDPTNASEATIDGEQTWTVAYVDADEAAYEAYVEQLRAAGEAGVSLNQEGLRSDTFTIGRHSVTAQRMDGIGLSIVVLPAS